MPDFSSKMQLRAYVIQLLSKYRNIKDFDSYTVSKDVAELKKIENKDYIARLLFKEIALSESPKLTNVCAILLLEVIDKATFETHAVNFLSNKDYSDEKKFLVISLIKQKGISFDYGNIENYVDTPEDVAQKGVKEFLQNAVFDPEIQIDFLDFYLNIKKNEKLHFLSSLSEEEDSDSVAHALSLLVQLNIEKDEFEEIIGLFLKLNSPYLIKGIDYILNNYDIDLKQRQKLNKRLNDLNKKFPNFKDDEIIKNSSIHDSYISFVDGDSNFSLIFSRKRDNNLLDLILLTINTKKGIIACMGFGNLSVSAYKTIKKRLSTDMPTININPIALKGIYKHYKEKNKKTSTVLPYELIVWERLFYDIAEINYDISKFINSKLTVIDLNDARMKKFLSLTMLDTWFWPYGQNKVIDELIDIIEKKHLIKKDDIEKNISKYIDDKALKNDELMVEMTDKLLLQAYVLSLSKLKISSAVAYTLCFEKNYFKIFLKSLINRSIYAYFDKINKENNKNDANILFKTKRQTNFSKEEIEKLITIFEERLC